MDTDRLPSGKTTPAERHAHDAEKPAAASCLHQRPAMAVGPF
jgi:hypothetical protein